MSIEKNKEILASDIKTFLVDISSDQTIEGTKTFSGTIISNGQHAEVVALSGTSIDVSKASCFTKTISAATTFSITGVTSGKSACFTLILTNGGSKTVTWPTSVKWAEGEVPELTSSGIDILTFITVNGGTTWYGSPSILNAQ